MQLVQRFAKKIYLWVNFSISLNRSLLLCSCYCCMSLGPTSWFNWISEIRQIRREDRFFSGCPGSQS